MDTMLVPPANLNESDADAWFARIAKTLLGSYRLRVAGALCRLVEIEFYFDGEQHRDPFAHRHPDQATAGRWYFHRVGPSYRGGSFKGVDLTFGDGDARGGVLLRSFETPRQDLVIGPSLCVDHVLTTTGSSSVAELARAIGGRSAFDATSPLHLVEAAAVDVTIFRSARVGLTLKRHNDAVAVDRLARPYRFLTEPRRVTKGRPELIAGLLAAGHSPEEVRRLTGSPMKAITAAR